MLCVCVCIRWLCACLFANVCVCLQELYNYFVDIDIVWNVLPCSAIFQILRTINL